jgi:hypothetical protein
VNDCSATIFCCGHNIASIGKRELSASTAARFASTNKIRRKNFYLDEINESE